MIPYGRQTITQEDIDAVIDVLRSDWLTQGPTVPRFEQAVSTYCQAKFSVAVNSATSALHIACLALEVGPGDVVWTSPTTFVASSNGALYCGADVDFVDIDPKTYNLSVERLAEKLVQAEKTGRLPKVVIPVHLCGQSCDMAGIHALARKYNFKIIEDASHAVGAKYKNEPVGNCRYSDIAVFSFHPVKIITTGEGGLAVTNNEALARRMQLFRSHGITSDRADMQLRPSDEIWNYQQVHLGFNYRMTDVQAALGLSQMAHLDEFVVKRHEIAEKYDTELKGLPIGLPWQHPDTRSSYHLYPVRIPRHGNKPQRYIYDLLTKADIRVNLHYIPVYLQPYYEALGFRRGYCEEAENFFRETVSLPVFPTLTAGEHDYVIDTLRKAFAE
ncbi:MAG: UDP-4-amino-4,6-dideoxy-N-acetyl-beta-L-altrosamine transaminase [Proteobacteria bacterium SG_bin9]|nr:MAG: UDP-4-amino-4,6-dideoxy-N-acetyl-beta-L-altrosamine transaminase [Proteobacteria bacterium SG_bin9]